MGTSVSHSREFPITITCRFLLVLLHGPSLPDLGAFLNSASRTLLAEGTESVLQILRWSSNLPPGARSHKLPAFTVLGVSASHPDRHRLLDPSSVKLMVWVFGAAV